MGNFNQGSLFGGSGRTVYTKPADDRAQEAEVLITVKASPQPSNAYGDTVCVAGIRIKDDGPEWVRLYPVPFRSMEDFEKFRKYDVVRVKIKPARDDPRAESFKPDRSSIRVVGHLDTSKNWEKRHHHVSPLARDWTMCGIQQARVAGKPFPSLAAIRPATITDLDIDKFGGWTPDQQAALDRNLSQPDLFGTTPKARALEAPRFAVKLRYSCGGSCRGHRQGVLDWELEAFSRHLKHETDAQAIDKIRQRFLREVCSPERGPLLFVGNQAKRQQIYSVLGFYRTL